MVVYGSTGLGKSEFIKHLSEYLLTEYSTQTKIISPTFKYDPTYIGSIIKPLEVNAKKQVYRITDFDKQPDGFKTPLFMFWLNLHRKYVD